MSFVSLISPRIALCGVNYVRYGSVISSLIFFKEFECKCCYSKYVVYSKNLQSEESAVFVLTKLCVFLFRKSLVGNYRKW